MRPCSAMMAHLAFLFCSASGFRIFSMLSTFCYSNSFVSKTDSTCYRLCCCLSIFSLWARRSLWIEHSNRFPILICSWCRFENVQMSFDLNLYFFKLKKEQNLSTTTETFRWKGVYNRINLLSVCLVNDFNASVTSFVS